MSFPMSDEEKQIREDVQDRISDEIGERMPEIKYSDSLEGHIRYVTREVFESLEDEEKEYFPRDKLYDIVERLLKKEVEAKKIELKSDICNKICNKAPSYMSTLDRSDPQNKEKCISELTSRFYYTELNDEEKSYFTEEEVKDLVRIYVNENEACFPPNASVLVQGYGRVCMDNLQIGDEVLCCNTQGKLFYDPVVLFSHADDNEWGLYVKIEVKTGETISLSPNHLLPVGDVNNLKPASDVNIGDEIFIGTEGVTLEASAVMSISYERQSGAYCPHTRCGTLVVDGVVASCYSTVLPVWLAHAMLFPVRLLYNTLPLSWCKVIVSYDEKTGMPKLLAKYRHLFL